MGLSQIITILFGLIATILGILLKAEYDKRAVLQQQVSEFKRKAYASFNEVINDLLIASKQKAPRQEIERIAKKLMDLRQGLWLYGSDEVIKAYSIWQQCLFAANENNNYSSGSIPLMADLIVKMRIDMGLSKKGSLKPVDILRMFVNDIEKIYDGMVKSTKAFCESFNSNKHLQL